MSRITTRSQELDGNVDFGICIRGTLNLGNTILSNEEALAWQEDGEELISILRQCPSYQIDSNHMHCGPRTRLNAALDNIRPFPQVGICLQCWLKDPHKESWAENAAGGKSVSIFVLIPSSPSPKSQLRDTRFDDSAAERVWNFQLPRGLP